MKVRELIAPIAAIDPGRDKCGLAVIDAKQGVIYQAVIPAKELPEMLLPLVRERGISKLIIGDRTGTQELIRRLRATGINLEIIMVDEHRSSEEGRRRFFADNPPTGLKRFLPQTLLFPDRAFDDYVAIVLAERYMKTLG